MDADGIEKARSFTSHVYPEGFPTSIVPPLLMERPTYNMYLTPH